MSTVDIDTGGMKLETYMTMSEQEVARSLEKSIPEGFSMEFEGNSIEVAVPNGASFKYMPDFTLKNTASGQTVAIEVKGLPSLSLANIVKLRMIQAAYERARITFLILVYSQSNEKEKIEALARRHGIRAAGFNSGEEAVAVITAAFTKHPDPDVTE